MAPTKLMGILNITPDSFFDESRRLDAQSAIRRGVDLYHQGADIIDIGGESSRPGALPVSLEEELARVIPAIQELKSLVPIPLSIDTTKVGVANRAVEAGASLINDITGFRDPALRELAAGLDVDVCVMHMQGEPQTMQINPSYENGIMNDLLRWFEDRIEMLLKCGVKKEKIIIDPGIGFGKTIADNVEIIQNLPKIKAMGFPVLLGLSRKSFMSKILNKPPSELLPATLVMNTVAILAKVDILRVHDVQEHRAAITLLEKFKSY